MNEACVTGSAPGATARRWRRSHCTTNVAVVKPLVDFELAQLNRRRWLIVAIVCVASCFSVSPVLATEAGAAKLSAIWSHSGRGSYQSQKFNVPASAAGGWRETWSYVCPRSDGLAKFTTSIMGYGAERNTPRSGAFGIGWRGSGDDPHFGAGVFSIDIHVGSTCTWKDRVTTIPS